MPCRGRCGGRRLGDALSAYPTGASASRGSYDSTSDASALTDGPPGTLLRLAGNEVPAFFGLRTSPHEVGLADLLAVTRLRGTEPGEVVVLGMQPAVVELGWDLSEPVAARLDALVDLAADELRRWGIAVAECDAPMPSERVKEAAHA